MDRRTFAICMLVNYFIQSYVSVFFLFPAALQEQGISLVYIGWVMSIFSIASTMLRPVAGTFTEKYGVRRTLIISSLGMFLVSAPLLFTENLVPLLFFRMLMGAAFSIAMVAVSSYQALLLSPEKRGVGYAWIAVSYVLPQVTVFPVGDLVLSTLGYKPYLMLAPLVALLCLVSSTRLSKLGADSGVNEAKIEWGRWRDLLFVRGFRVLQLSVFLFSLVNSSLLQYISAFISSKGLVPSSFFMANAGTALLIRLVVPRFMDIFDRRMLMGIATSWMGLIMFFITLAESNMVLILEGILYGFGMGVGFPVMLALMPDVFPDHLKPKGLSVSFLTLDTGFIISPVILGFAGERAGLGFSFAVLGISAFILGLLIYFTGWRPLIAEDKRI